MTSAARSVFGAIIVAVVVVVVVGIVIRAVYARGRKDGMQKESLPDELWMGIATVCKWSTLIKLGSTSRRLYDLLHDDRLWRTMCLDQGLYNPTRRTLEQASIYLPTIGYKRGATVASNTRPHEDNVCSERRHGIDVPADVPWRTLYLCMQMAAMPLDTAPVVVDPVPCEQHGVTHWGRVYAPKQGLYWWGQLDEQCLLHGYGFLVVLHVIDDPCVPPVAVHHGFFEHGAAYGRGTWCRLSPGDLGEQCRAWIEANASAGNQRSDQDAGPHAVAAARVGSNNRGNETTTFDSDDQCGNGNDTDLNDEAIACLAVTCKGCWQTGPTMCPCRKCVKSRRSSQSARRYDAIRTNAQTLGQAILLRMMVTYTGTWCEGMPHGLGRAFYSDISWTARGGVPAWEGFHGMYEGTWRCGRPWKRGTLTTNTQCTDLCWDDDGSLVPTWGLLWTDKTNEYESFCGRLDPHNGTYQCEGITHRESPLKSARYRHRVVTVRSTGTYSGTLTLADGTCIDADWRADGNGVGVYLAFAANAPASIDGRHHIDPKGIHVVLHDVFRVCTKSMTDTRGRVWYGCVNDCRTNAAICHGTRFTHCQCSKRVVYPNGDVLMCKWRSTLMSVSSFTVSPACPDARFAGRTFDRCHWKFARVASKGLSLFDRALEYMFWPAGGPSNATQQYDAFVAYARSGHGPWSDAALSLLPAPPPVADPLLDLFLGSDSKQAEAKGAAHDGIPTGSVPDHEPIFCGKRKR